MGRFIEIAQGLVGHAINPVGNIYDEAIGEDSTLKKPPKTWAEMKAEFEKNHPTEVLPFTKPSGGAKPQLPHALPIWDKPKPMFSEWI